MRDTKTVKDKLVKVIVPVYSNDLTADEIFSLNQCYNVLSRYDIVIIKPESLNVDSLCLKYSRLHVESFDDHYFRDVESYNELMLSSEFYERFLDSEYILIYQLDAFVFRDELEMWCEKSYDYIGAPWVARNIILKKVRDVFNLIFKKNRRQFYWEAYYKVGNGGFSLRRVASFYEIAVKEKKLIYTYLHQNIKYFPEDIFWTLEPLRKNYHFSTPGYKEGLLFSFDKYPQLCYSITKTIPFGCHAWNRKKMFSFWKDYIHIQR